MQCQLVNGEDIGRSDDVLELRVAEDGPDAPVAVVDDVNLDEVFGQYILTCCGSRHEQRICSPKCTCPHV